MVEPKEKAKKAPDYTNSAVNLCNPSEVGDKLIELHAMQGRIASLEADLEKNEFYLELQKCHNLVADMTAQIKDMVEAQGSYQDISNSLYAVKYVRKTKVFHVDAFKEHYPDHISSVIEEVINIKVLDGFIKGEIIPEADLRMHKVITDDVSYAFVVR